MGRGFLDVAQRDAGVEGGGDEGMPQGVRPDRLGDPGAAGDPADDPPGAVPVQPPPARCEEHRSLATLTYGKVDGAGGARGERDCDDLAALAGDHQGPVAPLGAHGLDICASGLRHPQPVQGEQGDQRVLGGEAEAGGDEQGAELVAVQGGGVRLVVQPGPAHLHGWGVVQELLLDGVPVEARAGAQPPGDGGPGAAAGFEVAGEALDVGAAGSEQGQVAALAPAGVLAQVQLVGLAGQAAVPGQESG